MSSLQNGADPKPSREVLGTVVELLLAELNRPKYGCARLFGDPPQCRENAVTFSMNPRAP